MDPSPPRHRLTLGLFLGSGVAALIYEVTWTRALSLVLGSTTYALSTMLSTFMVGLALGSWLGGRLADRRSDLLALFGWCELGVGLAGLASVPLIYQLPRLYLTIYRNLHLHPLAFYVVQVLLCAIVMLVPTCLMGATFPLVSRSITPSLQQLGRRVGSAYSFNTAGAVIGSLAAGFLLIPRLGISGAVLVAASVNLGVAAVAVLRSGGRGRLAILCGGLLLALLLGFWTIRATSPVFDLSFYNLNRFLDHRTFDDIVRGQHYTLTELFHREDREGTVRAYRDLEGHLIAMVGGKVEGTGARDLANTLLLAYLPVASHPAPRRMLVIGLGAGVTLNAARAVVPDVDLVEINPSVLSMVREHGPPGALDGIDTFRDDARRFLLLTEERYDIISAEPSYPTEPSVANLFSLEYYRLAAARLSPDGLYCQWLPYHMLTNGDVTMMIKTFTQVFPHAYLWRVPDGLDLLLVGSRAPFSRSEDEIRRTVDRLNSSRIPLHYELSRTPEEVTEIARRPGVPVNTDDRPRLEFRAADNLLLGDLSIRERQELREGIGR